jgi:hypothetical protein
VVQKLAGRNPGRGHESQQHGDGGSRLAGDPMDTSVGTLTPKTITVRAINTTPAQRLAWRKQGLCARCGGKGHWAKDCTQTPATTSSAGSSRVTVGGFSDDDSGGSSDDYESD